MHDVRSYTHRRQLQQRPPSVSSEAFQLKQHYPVQLAFLLQIPELLPAPRVFSPELGQLCGFLWLPCFQAYHTWKGLVTSYPARGNFTFNGVDQGSGFRIASLGLQLDNAAADLAEGIARTLREL